MRVVLANDFLGVIERSGGSRMPGRAHEGLTSTVSCIISLVWKTLSDVFTTSFVDRWIVIVLTSDIL